MSYCSLSWIPASAPEGTDPTVFRRIQWHPVVLTAIVAPVFSCDVLSAHCTTPYSHPDVGAFMAQATSTAAESRCTGRRPLAPLWQRRSWSTRRGTPLSPSTLLSTQRASARVSRHTARKASASPSGPPRRGPSPPTSRSPSTPTSTTPSSPPRRAREAAGCWSRRSWLGRSPQSLAWARERRWRWWRPSRAASWWAPRTRTRWQGAARWLWRAATTSQQSPAPALSTRRRATGRRTTRRASSMASSCSRLWTTRGGSPMRLETASRA
mmetsp:Transcript_32611/g.104373  ORF Transcript_32611/g.104373 Transcript_32611/m.104373 type:complete len:268 (-) Transcript_32611:1854-2657(-)